MEGEKATLERLRSLSDKTLDNVFLLWMSKTIDSVRIYHMGRVQRLSTW